MMSRNDRQTQVSDLVRDIFGDLGMDRSERVARFVEEAVELAQAEEIDRALVLAIVEHVYSKPAGATPQEVGGIGVTLLAFCAAAGISADDCELKEIARIRSFPAEHFRKRQQAKAAAGISKRSA
jgi:hypothetical protein